MKNIILILLLLPFVACNQTTKHANDSKAEEVVSVSAPALEAEITQLEKKIKTALDVGKNRDAAIELVEKSRAYATQFPKNKKTPEILFKAADVARGLGEAGKAIMLWGQVWRDYRDYEKAPDALFLQGLTYDNDLQNREQAANYYRMFTQQFPEHPLMEQVVLLQKALHKTPIELIRSFEEKQKE